MESSCNLNNIIQYERGVISLRSVTEGPRFDEWEIEGVHAMLR